MIKSNKKNTNIFNRPFVTIDEVYDHITNEFNQFCLRQKVKLGFLKYHQIHSDFMKNKCRFQHNINQIKSMAIKTALKKKIV